MSVVTIAERRFREIRRLEAAAAAVQADLAVYARDEGVRFVVFGSFARGDVVATSDLDLLVNGPENLQRAARAVAETACERHGIRPDVHLACEASERLMLRVRRDGRPVP